MPSHSHDHLRRLFDQIFLAPPEQRERLLDVQCKDDSDLRKRLEAMIAAAEDDGFLGEGAEIPSALDQGLSRTYGGAARESAGDFIDRYKLLEEIGEGGMGTVWMAEQSEPVKRRVALKVIKLGMDTKQVVARFEAERQALALMDHAHIAKVLDAGTSESGRPYFVMEYIRGIPILEYCDTHKLGTVERLELFGQVCSAIQHAHQKGIIHRDIKPNHVLVTLHDGEPVPKVIDFGIAKATNSELTQKTLFTEHRQLIGTPDYMSPEQAEMSGLDIDTRSDIYSLGVLLYELLTGTTPFDTASLMEAGLAEMMRVIREEEPHKPSTRVSSLGDTATSMAAQRATDAAKLGSALRGDLDWIVMKCLEKDRTRRYETANGLLADIQRHLRDEPVVAGPPSASYRLRKYVKRNRGKVVAAGVVAVVLLLGAAGTTLGLFWALDERARVEAQAGRASEALRQVTEDFASILPGDGSNGGGEAETPAPMLARDGDGEVAALATTAVHLVRSLDVSNQAARRAEAEAKARTAELDQVVAFQASQLAGVDARAMGAHLEATIVDAAPEEEREAMRAALAGVNFTEIALGTLEANIFERSLEAISTSFADQPLVQAELLVSVGMTLVNLGLLESAVGPWERALALRQAELGNDDPIALSSEQDLAILYKSLGRPPEVVEAMLLRVIEVLSRADSAPDTQVINAKASLADTYQSQERYDEALPLLEAVLEERRQVEGDDAPATLGALLNLGVCHTRMRRFDAAEELLEQAREGYRRVYGDDHPSTALSVASLGHLYWRLVRLDEAEKAFRNVLEVQARFLGDKHPRVLNTMNSLAIVLTQAGRPAEALPLLMKELEYSREALGDEHVTTLGCITNIGDAYQAQGRYEDAVRMYETSLPIKRRVLGLEHSWTGIALGKLADALLELGRREDARPVLQEYLEHLTPQIEQPEPSAMGLSEAAWVLTRGVEPFHDPAGALEYAERACLLGEAEEHPYLFNYLGNLAEAQYQTGDTESAVDSQRRGLALAPEHRRAELAERLAELEAELEAD